MRKCLIFKRKIISAIVVDWFYLTRENTEHVLLEAKAPIEKTSSRYEKRIDLISRILSFT